MIFYFSGTGNSKWVAETIAKALDERVIAMADYMKPQSEKPIFSIRDKERIGFVSPIHSWGIPPRVQQFIEELSINNYDGQQIFVIFTCGDQCGDAKKMVANIIKGKGWECRHIYSVQMPNNYIAMPGFNIDDISLQKTKKIAAKELLPRLAEAIKNDSPIDCYTKGGMTFLKSGLVYPLFRSYCKYGKSFRYTEDCVGCGLCSFRCPTGNISMKDGHPSWDNRCTQCLACIHYCPHIAIEYGKASVGKGRYHFEEE